MRDYEAVFSSKSLMNCQKCAKKFTDYKHRIEHVLQHVFKDAKLKIYACNKCPYHSYFLPRISKHVKFHIIKKEKKKDPMEIRKHFDNLLKKHEKVICDMSIACFKAPMEIVKKRRITGGKVMEVVEIEDDDENEAENGNNTNPIPMDEAEMVEISETDSTPASARIIQGSFFQNVNNGAVVMDPVAGDDEAEEPPRMRMGFIFGDQNQEIEAEEVLPDLPAGVNPADLQDYQLQADWTFKELSGNMRIVGQLLGLSDEDINSAADLIDFGEMDCSMFFFLSRFLDDCQASEEVRITVYFILEAMGYNTFEGREREG